MLTGMLFIKHVGFKFNPVVAVDIESLYYILCLLKCTRDKEETIQPSTSIGTSTLSKKMWWWKRWWGWRGRAPRRWWSAPGWPPARQAPEEWEHRPRRRSPWTTAPGFPPFPSHFSPALRELVFRQFDNFQATRSLSKKKVFLMSLSIFFIRVLSPARVVISSLFLLDPLLPITRLVQKDFPGWDALQLLLLRASDECSLAECWYWSGIAKLIASQANCDIAEFRQGLSSRFLRLWAFQGPTMSS